MKKVFALILSVLIFSGCSGDNEELDRMMNFRASMLSGLGCRFQVAVTSDYQSELYQFKLDCRSDEHGNLFFTVTEPQSISGISGNISNEGGKLTFNDEHGLAFELIADGQITPVSAPWLLVKTLRGGYVTACGNESELMKVSIDDSFEDDTLTIDIWFTNDDIPAHAEILWANRRILSLEVTNFEIL